MCRGNEEMTHVSVGSKLEGPECECQGRCNRYLGVDGEEQEQQEGVDGVVGLHCWRASDIRGQKSVCMSLAYMIPWVGLHSRTILCCSIDFIEASSRLRLLSVLVFRIILRHGLAHVGRGAPTVLRAAFHPFATEDGGSMRWARPRWPLQLVLTKYTTPPINMLLRVKYYCQDNLLRGSMGNV